MTNSLLLVTLNFNAPKLRLCVYKIFYSMYQSKQITNLMSHCNLNRQQITFSRQAFNYKICHRHFMFIRDKTNIVQSLKGLRVITVNIINVAFPLLGIV